MTVTDDQTSLFEMTPTPRERGRPVTELRKIHDAGRKLLEPVVKALYPTEPGVYRTRVWTADPSRAHEVTVRYTAPSHRKSKEWEGLTHGDERFLAYAWLTEDGELMRYVVLDGAELVEAMITRPQCLVPSTRTVVTHHAPGGAEFLVVDLRKVPNTVLRDAKGTGEIAAWGKMVAPRVQQGGLW